MMIRMEGEIVEEAKCEFCGGEGGCGDGCCECPDCGVCT